MSSPVFVIDSAQQWIPVSDPLTGHRQETWHVDLLNLRDVNLGRLDGVTGGNITYDVNASIRGGGNIDYAGEPVDWLQYRVQPWYSIRVGKTTVEWPLGVFIPASPSTAYGTAPGGSIELYDKTLILDQDAIETTFTAAKGAKATDIVRSVILATGETHVALTDSDQTLRKSMAWEPGTSRLRIVNDLLAAINYFAVWCDGNGTYRAGPYAAPDDRLPQYGFVDDERGIYLPEFTHEFDTFNIPNKVICVAEGDGESAALTAVATNTNPNSPFSQPSRGRWITRVEDSVEASDQTTLNAIAKRYLAEGQQVGSTYSIQHAPLDLWVHDAVEFKRLAEGIAITATIQSISYPLTNGALCSTSLQEV